MRDKTESAADDSHTNSAALRRAERVTHWGIGIFWATGLVGAGLCYGLAGLRAAAIAGVCLLLMITIGIISRRMVNLQARNLLVTVMGRYFGKILLLLAVLGSVNAQPGIHQGTLAAMLIGGIMLFPILETIALVWKETYYVG